MNHNKTSNNKANNDKSSKPNEFRKNLAMSALDEIPTPKSDAKTIKAMVKESNRTVGYELSDETFVPKEQAIDMARNGEIEGVGIAHNGDTEYLKSLPDDREDNNLSSKEIKR